MLLLYPFIPASAIYISPPLRPSVLLPFIPGHLLCTPIPAYILYRSFPALTSLIPVRILRLHIGVPVALRHCYILFMDPLFHLFYQTFYLQLYFRFISRLALIFPKSPERYIARTINIPQSNPRPALATLS